MNHVLKLAFALGVSVAAPNLSLGANAPATVFEDFRGDPLTNGWQVFGETNLFAWNRTNQNVEVTWDSSKPNSYFYTRLGRAFTRNDDFILYFDLQLRDIAIGTTTNKPYTFQIAVGLLNFQQATNGGFLRGTGFDSPDVFEFDYFPDSGFGATISPTVISSNNEFATAFVLQEITPNDLFKVTLHMDEEEGRVAATIHRNGEVFASQFISFPTNFTDFNVDTVAIASYSDEGQFPDFAGSVLAHGTVDNVVFASGGLPLNLGFGGRFENGNWRMDFDTFPGWFYYIERTADFQSAFTVGSVMSTNYGRATIVHTNPPASPPQFYRLWGQRL